MIRDKICIQPCSKHEKGTHGYLRDQTIDVLEMRRRETLFYSCIRGIDDADADNCNIGCCESDSTSNCHTREKMLGLAGTDNCHRIPERADLRLVITRKSDVFETRSVSWCKITCVKVKVILSSIDDIKTSSYPSHVTADRGSRAAPGITSFHFRTLPIR